MKPVQKKRLFAGIVVCIFIVVFAMVRVTSVNPYAKRLEWTLIRLNAARDAIKVFRENNGRYPDSLLELQSYDDKTPQKKLLPADLKEYISDKTGNGNESTVLNGQGGFYYNKDNGQVKVNLTKPLKDHFDFYIWKDRNEIPADW